MSMTKEQAEALMAQRAAELAAEGHAVGLPDGTRLECDMTPVVPVEERVQPGPGVLREEVLAAFGVTEDDLKAVDPDGTYAEAKRAAEADREFAQQAIQEHAERLTEQLNREAAGVYASFILPMAREVGCPTCGKSDPYSTEDPEQVCRCGFDWGDGT